MIDEGFWGHREVVTTYDRVRIVTNSPHFQLYGDGDRGLEAYWPLSVTVLSFTDSHQPSENPTGEREYNDCHARLQAAEITASSYSTDRLAWKEFRTSYVS